MVKRAMNLAENEINTYPTLIQTFALQQGEQPSKTRHLLASRDGYLFDQLDIKVIYGLLTHFPHPQLNQVPELHYLHALLLRRTGQPQQAIQLLEKAKAAYTATQQFDGVVCCCLELASIAQLQEDFDTADRYLRGEIQPLIDRQWVKDASLQAHFFLGMANYAYVRREYQRGLTYAQQALLLYTSQGYGYGQLLARLRLAVTSIPLGDYQEAEHQFEKAKEQVTSGKLGALAEAHLLRAQLMLEWYRRELTAACQTAQQYLTLVDAEPYSNDRIYARLMLGNLYRDLGEFSTAHDWYVATSDVIEQVGAQHYWPYLNAELAWLYLLEGRLHQARALLHTQQINAQQKQIMHRQVILAVLQMLDGEWESAQKLLYTALTFYEQVNEPLAVCALHLYLAYNALHQQHPTQILFYLARAFGWLAARQFTTFPDWWHPKIVAEVCIHALISDLYPTLVEQILVKHVGKTGINALKLLEKTADIELRRTAYRLIQVINGITVDPLAHLRDSPSKQALQAMIVNGQLRPEAYTTLEQELMTANNRFHPNPTIVAVFGLYVNGAPRADIAKQLGCSIENVRNYITSIYQYFALPVHRFPTRESRKTKLIEIARERGFIH